MEERLAEQSCLEFTARLASRAPTPGGGGAAAMAGALAAALCAMAGEVTRYNPRYAGCAEYLRQLCAEAEAIRVHMLSQIDADAVAFAPLAQAYKLPKDAPGRGERLRRATLDACAAPMEMLRLGARLADTLERMLTQAGPMLLSDVGCGALLGRAAMEAAAINVRVNTRSLGGDAEAEKLEEEMQTLLASALPRLETVAAAVDEELKRK